MTSIKGSKTYILVRLVHFLLCGILDLYLGGEDGVHPLYMFSTIEKGDHLVTLIKPNSNMVTPNISILHENVNIESMLLPKPRNLKKCKQLSNNMNLK
jgi:hypothetical protein